MKKTISLIIFSIILFFPIFVNQVFSAEAYLTGCLSVVEEDLKGVSIDGKSDHIVKVKGTGFPPDKDIYIVGCISTPDGIRCTSGDSQINNKLNQMGFVTNPIDGHEFKAMTNPIKSTDRNVEVILRSFTAQFENHSFFGVAEINEDYNTGDAKSVSFGTFGFSEDPKKCVGISWDPKGRVFDSESLEPLPAVIVTLLDSNRNKVTLPGVINPLTTKEDGLFNFFVPNGTYYLEVNKISYQHPLLLSEINPKYRQIYYCDKEVGQHLYYDQFPIKQEGRLIHCDIPLKPKGSAYIAPQVLLIDYGQIRLGGTTKIYGTFSHPLTKVKITKDGVLIKEIMTDKYGGWTLFLDNSELPVSVTGLKNENIFSQTKNNLIKKIASIFLKTVFSQNKNSSFVFHPILTYVEGYAYDSKGEIIPGAIVNIIPEMTKKTYYTTYADDKGFFMVETNKLPIVPFYIQIIAPKNKNQLYTYTTTDFIKQNQEYLKIKGISLMTDQKIKLKEQKLILTNTPLPNQISNQKNTFEFATKEQSKKRPSLDKVKEMNSQDSNYFFLILGIIIFTLASILVLYYLYIKKKED